MRSVRSTSNPRFLERLIANANANLSDFEVALCRLSCSEIANKTDLDLIWDLIESSTEADPPLLLIDYVDRSGGLDTSLFKKANVVDTCELIELIFMRSPGHLPLQEFLISHHIDIYFFSCCSERTYRTDTMYASVVFFQCSRAARASPDGVLIKPEYRHQDGTAQFEALPYYPPLPTIRLPLTTVFCDLFFNHCHQQLRSLLSEVMSFFQPANDGEGETSFNATDAAFDRLLGRFESRTTDPLTPCEVIICLIGFFTCL